MSLPVVDLELPVIPLSDVTVGSTFTVAGQETALYQRADPTFFEQSGGVIPAGQILVNILNNGTQGCYAATQLCAVRNVRIAML